ncbi:MAG: dihydropteridine reductase [Eubacterium sp.]
MNDYDKIYAQSIAKEYAPKKSSKISALRKLDNKAKMPAIVFTYSFGILGALILGIGMCLAMNVIGNGSALAYAGGIIIGIIGIAVVSVNYPIYKKILAKNKQKYAFEILELAREIGGDNEDN